MGLNKERIKENLRDQLSKQSFADFYKDDGAFGKEVMGDYKYGSLKFKRNQNEVNDFLNKMVDKLLVNVYS